MKILYVIDQLNPGGAERVCVDQANMMFQAGHQVGVLSLLDKGILEDELYEGINRYYLRRKSRLSWKAFYGFNKILRGYEIIHLHSRHVLAYYIVTISIFRANHPTVFQDHSGIKKKRSLLQFAMKRFIYVGVSRDICDWSEKAYSLDHSKVFNLPNIIKRKVYREENALTKKIVLVSNIRSVKNIEFALDIINALNKKDEVHLDIYGARSEEGYFLYLRQKIAEYKLQNKVRFIHDETDIQSVLSKYTLGLHTSPNETGPLALIEYVAQKLPFVAYKTGQVAVQLGNTFPEFFIDNYDLTQWAERITTLLAKDKKQYATKLEECFNNNFSEKQYLSQCLEIYRHALNY